MLISPVNTGDLMRKKFIGEEKAVLTAGGFQHLRRIENWKLHGCSRAAEKVPGEPRNNEPLEIKITQTRPAGRVFTVCFRVFGQFRG
ncbi:MAG: hypothetical protein WCS42_27930 [Verrucomicrobiota bacterium]